ncbi:MAG: ATP-binding protein [Kofleriaceae bacterium]
MDDDDLVRRALLAELSPQHEVHAAASGGEAFVALARQPFDVVVSDLSMPDHDGLEVLAVAQQLQADAVRVLLTGYLDDHARRALAVPGAPLHVSKPWHGELEATIARGLAARAEGTAGPAPAPAPTPAPARLSALTARIDRRDRRSATAAQPGPGAGARRGELLRAATVGTMTSSLLHDLAALVQVIDSALGEVAPAIAALGDSGLTTTVDDARLAGTEAVALFTTMRRFIRDGELTHGRVSVRVLVERAIRVVGSYVRARARLRVAPVPDLEVEVCEPMVLQVIANLLRNAANASPPDGTVDLVVSEAGDALVLEVIDDGPGVSPEVAEVMFEPLATTTAEGTGLGLMISGFVAELHGGDIRYARAHPRGACFRVTLPRRAASAPAPS